MPNRAKIATPELASLPGEPHAEGAARKRPRRDADRAATPTIARTHDDDLLCDWIDAFAWLETGAANVAAAGQVRRLRELAAASGKQPVARAGLNDAVWHFHV